MQDFTPRELFKAYFQQAWLVLLLAVVLSAALAVVDRSLRPRIEANAKQRLERAVLSVVPSGTTSERLEESELVVYRVQADQNELVGWAVPAETVGFAGPMKLLVGLSADGQEVTGLVVLESTETPGLGENVRSAEFREQFVGRPASSVFRVASRGVALESNQQPVEAVTGATISSQAVTEGVNRTLTEVRELIDRLRAGGRVAAEKGPAG